MKRTHTHRPFCGIVIAFMAGILCRVTLGLPFQSTGFLCLFFLAGAVLFSGKRKIAVCCLLCSFMVLGAAYTAGYRIIPEDHIEHAIRYHRKRPAKLRGIVISDVRHGRAFRGGKTSFFFDVREIEVPWGWQRRRGKILVNVFRNLSLDYGDELILEGKLHYPFEFSEDTNFSYRAYLEQRGVKLMLSVKRSAPVEVTGKGKGYPVKSAALRLRHRLEKIFAQHLTVNQAGLMQAVILGNRDHIPEHIRTLFVETGTAHILAISGLHIGIVVFLIFVLVKLLPLPWRWHYILTIVLLVGYAFLTGGRVSVVRATVMAAIFLAGFLVERETDSLNSLALAALVILLINPMNLFDVGFQLSFTCVLFIVTGYPLIMRFVPEDRLRREHKTVLFLVRSLAVSSLASVGAAGWVAYYFQIITPVTILANLAVIPLISVVVTLGMGLITIAFSSPAGAAAFAVCLKVALNIMVGVIYLFDQLPGSHLYLGKVSVWHVGIYYACVLFGLLGCRGIGLTKKSNYDTVSGMSKIISIIILSLALLFSFPGKSFAFWIWTPETNKWVNPKYAVQETPQKQLAYARSFYDSKEYADALNEFQKLIKFYPKAREAAEAQYFIGKTMEQQGRLVDSYKAYQMVVDKYPFSDRFPEIIAKEYEIGNRILEGEQDKSGFWGTVLGSNYDVIEIFKTVIKNSPYGEYAAPSQYKIALYLQEKQLYQEARDEFEKVINDYPESEWAKAAQYQLAITDARRSSAAAYDQKVTQIAIEQFKDFVKNNPDAELTDNAQNKIRELRDKEAENNFITAKYYEKTKNYKAARIYYNGIIQDFNDTPWAQKAMERVREIENLRTQ